jgi:drug/metabolite transporter (DMT)-like permease
VPSFSLLVAVPLLRELPTRLQLAGVVLVTLGMLFALGLHDPAKWRPQRAAEPR